MNGHFKGPSLLVHILIVAMINGFFFPLFYEASGSLLYAFLTSVGVLGIYGLIVILLFRHKER